MTLTMIIIHSQQSLCFDLRLFNYAIMRASFIL